MTQGIEAAAQDQQLGKTFFLDIEGVEHPWHQDTITTEEIAQLGGWDVSAGVIEIDKDNNERTLASGEVIELKPGHGFAKKIRWKRGDNLFEARLDEELELLRRRFPDAKRQGVWFLLPAVPLPSAGWNRQRSDIALRAQTGHPATPPYGFYVPAGLRVNDATPDNYQEPVSEATPFGGAWGLFSWAAEDGQWQPSANAERGSNMLDFALGVLARLGQGK